MLMTEPANAAAVSRLLKAEGFQRSEGSGEGFVVRTLRGTRSAGDHSFNNPVHVTSDGPDLGDLAAALEAWGYVARQHDNGLYVEKVVLA